MTLVSIISPVLNGERYIGACIRNVAEQAVPDLEHIVVDGGSTDETRAIVCQLQRQNSSLTLISGPDRGQSDALNKGILRARSDIIGILNCDDFYEEGAIREAVDILWNSERPTLVVGNCRILDQYGLTIDWNRPRDLRLESLLLGWNLCPFPCNPSAYFYHKSAHEVIGYYDVTDHFTMDFGFILACVENINVRYVNRHWGNFRFQPGTKTFDDRETAERQRVLINRYVGALSLSRRLKMKRRLAEKAARGFAYRQLQRIGLR
jgi:glycosyltransferase involved in cell wall biosynthesis